MNVFAIFLVVTAGTMWAACGLAAEHFLSHSLHTALDLTVVRMFFTALIIAVALAVQGKLKKGWLILRKNPRLWTGVIFYGLGIMIMQHTYFAGIGSGNAAAATVIQYMCPAIVICWVAFQNRRVPGKGEIISVILALTGVFLLVTGGDIRGFSVPPECVFYSLISAGFYAFCTIYPKRLMVALDNSFVLMFAMLFGGLFGYIFNPITELVSFFAPDVMVDLLVIILGGTVIAFICYNAGLMWLSEGEVAVTATVEPAISVIFSYFLFGTVFGWVESIGIFFVLLAIVTPARFRRKV